MAVIQGEILPTHQLSRPSTQFTVEETRSDGSMPFLDIIRTPQTDGTFTTDFTES